MARSRARARCWATRTAPGGHAELVAGLLRGQAGQHPEDQQLALLPGQAAQQGPYALGLQVGHAVSSGPGRSSGPSGRSSVGIASLAALRMASATLWEAMPNTNEANGRPMS